MRCKAGYGVLQSCALGAKDGGIRRWGATKGLALPGIEKDFSFWLVLVCILL